MSKRACGILLHITSLPKGTLGEGAFAFADKLKAASQSYWQILPLNPVLEGDSPYFSSSVFAGAEHLVPDAAPGGDEKGFADFKEDESFWLDDYALFTALKRRDKRAFFEWDERYKKRDLGALVRFASENEKEIDGIKRAQYEFFRRWRELKGYCNDSGIQIIGDVPFYTAPDSADCWAHPGLFNEGCVGGCPPDDFSEDGQLWGNPTYDFERMAKDGYKWWIERFKHAADMYDVVRVDHFRGFESYYAITGDTAREGSWVKGPGWDLFKRVFESVPGIKLIAEDLGFITPEVVEFIGQCGIPGTRVLQFAFDGDAKNTHLPHNVGNNSVMYTGTHDNDTANGWFRTAGKETRELFSEYSGKSEKESAADAMLRLLYSSVSDIAIAPMQDVLGLDDARMNTPGTVGGRNWKWRMDGRIFSKKVIKDMVRRADIYGRA